MKTNLIYPLGYRVVRRSVKDSKLLWFFQRVEVFFNPINYSVSDISDIEGMFGTTKTSVVTDLVDKKYYYCGNNLDDVKAKFIELGVVNNT